MREIRFRAWDEKSKRWDHFNLRNAFFYAKKLSEHLLNGDEFYLFTSLHDKNGKEIWEGDIVRTYRQIGRGYRENDIEIVHYSEITARWYPIDVIVTERCEVIGNIHENPELLKKDGGVR